MTEWIAAGAAVVSAVLAGFAARYARRQGDAAGRSAAASEESAQHAGRSATAAEKAEAHAGRSADADQRMASIEEDRAHQESRPDIKLSFSRWISQHSSAELVISNHSGAIVPSVLVELVSTSELAGFGAERPREKCYELERLESGISYAVPFATVHAGLWHENIVRFRVTVRGDDREWEPRIEPVELPGIKGRVRFG